MCCSAKSLPNGERGFCTRRGTKRSFCSIWTFTLWQIHALETTDYNMGRKQTHNCWQFFWEQWLRRSWLWFHLPPPFTNITPYLWPYWIKLCFLGGGKKRAIFILIANHPLKQILKRWFFAFTLSASTTMETTAIVSSGGDSDTQYDFPSCCLPLFHLNFLRTGTGALFGGWQEEVTSAKTIFGQS